MLKKPSLLPLFVLGCALLGAASARAGLFEDEDARKAVLENRQRLEELKNTQRSAASEIEKMKQSMLDEANVLEGLRAEIATLRGEKDTLTKDLSDTQRKLKDISQSIEARLVNLEPVKVRVDGSEILVQQSERREFEGALDQFKKGDFASSASAFDEFLKHYPQSGYKVSALFWLGNSQYATREYKDSIANFRMLLTLDAKHPRAAEALLSISNCQLDMKDTKAAKKTWDELIKNYPDSEAAAAAKEQMNKLR